MRGPQTIEDFKFKFEGLGCLVSAATSTKQARDTAAAAATASPQAADGAEVRHPQDGPSTLDHVAPVAPKPCYKSPIPGKLLGNLKQKILCPKP